MALAPPEADVLNSIFTNPSSTYSYQPSFFDSSGSSGSGGGSTFNSILGALPAITGAIGAGRNVYNAVTGKGGNQFFDPTYAQETTKKLKQEAADALAEIEQRFANLAGLTGISTEDAVQDYENRYKAYFEPTQAQGRKDVYEFQPSLGSSYDTSTDRIAELTKQYSLLNNDKFMEYAKNPATVTMDVASIKNVIDLDDPKYKVYSDYSGPQTSQFIYGKPDTSQQQAAFYANSPQVKSLMTYNV